MTDNSDQATINDAEQKAKTTQTVSVVTDVNERPASNPPAVQKLFDPNKLGILDEVSVAITIEIGRAQIKIRDLLNLTKDSIIDLDKLAGEPVDVYANGKLISQGNIITVNGKYCVRLISIPKTPVQKEA